MTHARVPLPRLDREPSEAGDPDAIPGSSLFGDGGSSHHLEFLGNLVVQPLHAIGLSQHRVYAFARCAFFFQSHFLEIDSEIFLVAAVFQYVEQRSFAAAHIQMFWFFPALTMKSTSVA